MDNNLLSIEQAVKLVNTELNKNISAGNINYLLKYGQIYKHVQNGMILIEENDIRNYYNNSGDAKWKSKGRNELNWELSFSDVKEYERTKHVHRLHPYKGKFIPQLVEYFLDNKTNGLKKEVFFHPGDIVIDPFCGSGTTLVQANELGLNAVGVDISEFNSLMSNIKVKRHDLILLQKLINQISQKLKIRFENDPWKNFDNQFGKILSDFNKENFPTPEIIYKIRKGEVEIDSYSKIRVSEVNLQFLKLLQEFGLILNEANPNKSFVNKWFTPPIKSEIVFLVDQINNVENDDIKNVLRLILSRTARSCRATTHSDLATLIDPVLSPYYCYKHNKICKPLFSLSYWWEFYANDTVKRLAQYAKIMTDTHQVCITGDSRTIDIFTDLQAEASELFNLLQNKKAKGIFTSPPYVGLIDYHEQHAYAYELFNIQRRDSFEIGPMTNGKGRISRDKYVEDISQVFSNFSRFLVDDCEIFVVANDSYNLYPSIADKASLRIVEEFMRPVLNRTEKDKSSYSEKIFRLKRK